MHVLIVDDNDADLLLAHEAFEHADATVRLTTCSSAEDALRVLGDLPESALPDLILLDVNMPGMDGFELLAELKAHTAWRALPVILLSTSEAPRDIARAEALQASAYVVKPTAFAVFRERIEALVAYWMGAVPPTVLPQPADVRLPSVPG